MIDYFSGFYTEFFAEGGNIMVFCHRRHAVVNLFFFFFFFKGQLKSPILHNTRDGSEFYVPKILAGEYLGFV